MRMPQLKSERLLLRSLTMQDADVIESICACHDVSKNLERIPYPYPKGNARTWLERQSKGVDGINLGISHQDRLVGIIGIKPSTERANGDFVPSIGYWLAPSFWGKGFMQEAARRLLDWYMPHEPTERMRSAVFEDNPRSLQVLSKLGFREIGRSTGNSLAREGHVPQIDLELTTERYMRASHEIS
jgi:[ribosomal protein S5]-alanine N-acetyltransferase